MPSSNASTRDSWSEPLAPVIFRVSDVGAILQKTVPSVSMTPTTHNNCRVSMAAFYKPIPPIRRRDLEPAVATWLRLGPLIFHQSRGIDGGDSSGWTDASSGSLHCIQLPPPHLLSAGCVE